MKGRRKFVHKTFHWNPQRLCFFLINLLNNIRERKHVLWNFSSGDVWLLISAGSCYCIKLRSLLGVLSNDFYSSNIARFYEKRRRSFFLFWRLLSSCLQVQFRCHFLKFLNEFILDISIFYFKLSYSTN